MDEIKKSNIDEKKSLFGKIKSKYVQKWIFNFISKYKYPEFANKFLKYNNGLSHLQLEITNDNRINRLSDFRNWYHDLKDIYSVLNEISKEVYESEYLQMETLEKEPSDQYKSQAIEAIIYMCLFDIISLSENKKIFNADDLKIQKAESRKNEDLEKVSLKATIWNIIRGAINRSLNSKNSDLKNSIDTLFLGLPHWASVYNENKYAISNICVSIRNHLAKKFPKYKEGDNRHLQNDLCCLILKIFWLKNNNFYHNPTKIYNKILDYLKLEGPNFNDNILYALELPDINDTRALMNKYDFDYGLLISRLQKCCSLYSFACGNDDFDIRAYSSSGLQSAIKYALPTKEKKDKFQTFLEGQEQPKQKKDKSICAIF